MRKASLVFFTVLGVFFCFLHATTALVQQAQSAELFADSVCVNTHFRFLGTAYQTNKTALIELLAQAGIYNVRDDSIEIAGQLGSKGIKMNYGRFEPEWHTNSNSSIIVDMMNTIKKSISEGLLIDAVLSVNEPDGMWGPPKNITYNGQGFPGGVMDYMRDMHRLIRQDPAFDDIWIVGSPLSIHQVLPANCCSQWIDFGDFHPYPFNGNWRTDLFEPYDTISRYFYNSNQPTTNLDQHPDDWVRAKSFYPDVPWFCTETGYTTSQVPMGTSIRAQGLYTNRLFTEYFRLGIRRTCIYELLNGHDNPDENEDNFGILFANYTAKPSYTALKNLMALVRSDWKPSSEELRPPTYSLASLDFDLEVSAVDSYNRTDYVHHLLLQKPDGVLLLLLWHEISVEDTSTQPHRQIYPPRMPTVLTLPPRYAVRIFAPNDGPGLSGEYSNGQSTFIRNTTISLSVPDHVIVLQLDALPSAGVSLTQTGIAINVWRFVLAQFM